MSKIVSLLLLVLLLQACQSNQTKFATPDARWQTSIGQLQYTSPKRSIIGDCVVSVYRNEQFQLDFMAGPGFPLMKLRIAGNLARAEGAFALYPWQGKTDFPPAHLKSWVTAREPFYEIALHQAASDQVTFHSSVPGFWTGSARLVNGKPEEVRIDFPRSREKLIFHLGR